MNVTDASVKRRAETSAHPKVFVNGKFLAQRTTGVQRVARALLQAIDADLALPAESFVILAPAMAQDPGLRRMGFERIGPASLPLHVWEQTALPWAARRGLLLSLSGSSPWMSGRCAVMLHDAAIWDVPDAYSQTFRTWYRALFRHLGHRAEAVFTVSAYSARRLTLLLGLPQGRCVVLRNGADHLDAVAEDARVLQRLGLHEGRFLLTVGSHSPAKNLTMLAAAYAASGLGPAVPLVRVGGASRGVYAAGSEGPTELPPGWIDAGVLADAELKALYGRAIALLVPSRHEGFCLPAAEAIQAGCTVLASRTSALPELFGDTVASLSPDDGPAWTSAMRRLVADGAWRRDLWHAGRRSLGDARWALTARGLVDVVLPEAA